MLQALLDTDQYSISVLVRSKEQAARLGAMGVTPILSDLDAVGVIKAAAKRSDVSYIT